MQVTQVSEAARRTEIPAYEPLPEENLTQIVHVCQYGLALHRLVGVAENERPLPMHIHPATLLSMIQEIRRHRDG